MVASFARGETETKPTLLHDPQRPAQHSPAIGLAAADYQAIVDGMEQCAQIGTGRLAQVDGLRMANKTGTAQKGQIDLAWMVAFAPIDNPRIAIAVVMEGTEPGVDYHGGTYAAPVVKAILEAWKEKSERAPTAPAVNFKVE
jgi:penicillin-binding protein 2